MPVVICMNQTCISEVWHRAQRVALKSVGAGTAHYSFLMEMEEEQTHHNKK